jgi:hypothetical protein
MFSSNSVMSGFEKTKARKALYKWIVFFMDNFFNSYTNPNRNHIELQ